MTRISLKIISDFLKKYYFWILGFLFIALVCLSFFIYYEYIYLLMRTETGFVNNEITIDKETFQKILDNVDIRSETLLRVQTSQYSDPFN